MRVVCVNYYYDSDLATPEELLLRYDTLVGWSDGLAAAGADCAVVQRFKLNASVTRGSAPYHFVPDRGSDGFGYRAAAVNEAVVGLRPDVIHVNGMNFAMQAWKLKSLLPKTPIVLQDHAGRPPRSPIARVTLRAALRHIDAMMFTARDQAAPWLKPGLLSPESAIIELMEGSSRFSLLPRGESRARTRLDGDPLCLWVGRLDSNKDPLTVLRGFERALHDLPRARLAMVYGEDRLLPEVQAWLHDRPGTGRCVTLIGRRPHAELEAIYNSADFFLLGSHREGSGYAALEALSCGVVPILTDIPSFRRLTDNGRCGGLWPVGDSAAMAGVLVDWESRLAADTRLAIRRFFEERFAFEAIGRDAVAAYAALIPQVAPVPTHSFRAQGTTV